MNEFIKIFIGISALATAFFLGRNYGENIYNESVEHKSIIKTANDLTYTKNEFENVKVKLQNIMDQADNKKTEDLLEQILKVFLTDLEIKIKNKEAILKRATNNAYNEDLKKLIDYTPPTPNVLSVVNSQTIKNNLETETETEIKNKTIKDVWDTKKTNKFKSYEWMVKNSNTDSETIRALKRVQIKNLNTVLNVANEAENEACLNLLGTYKGDVKNIDNNNFGKLEFKLNNIKSRESNTNIKNELTGKTAWYRNKKIMLEQNNTNCGKKINGIAAQVFGLSADKYIQIYKLNLSKKIAGNFYEVLPNGTSKIIGSFVLE